MEKDKLRLFIGTRLDLNDIYPGHFYDRLKDSIDIPIKWVDIKNIHLTWKFIGDVEVDKVDSIIEVIQSVLPRQAVTIEFNKFEIWPKPRSPKQLVITGKDVSLNATCFYNDLNCRLQECGVEKDNRKFNPHITCGRFKLKTGLRSPVNLPDWLKAPDKVKTLHNVELLQSELTPKGSIYKTIKLFGW